MRPLPNCVADAACRYLTFMLERCLLGLTESYKFIVLRMWPLFFQFSGIICIPKKELFKVGVTSKVWQLSKRCIITPASSRQNHAKTKGTLRTVRSKSGDETEASISKRLPSLGGFFSLISLFQKGLGFADGCWNRSSIANCSPSDLQSSTTGEQREGVSGNSLKTFAHQHVALFSGRLHICGSRRHGGLSAVNR